MRSFTVKENHISSAFSKILNCTQSDFKILFHEPDMLTSYIVHFAHEEGGGGAQN